MIRMIFSKQNSQFNKIQKDVYKKLNELESIVKDPVIRKRITILIDKTSSLKNTQNSKIIGLLEDTSNYVRELKKELMNPVDLVLSNYLDKIDSLLNQIKYESEE